jgi:hypothetical protein
MLRVRETNRGYYRPTTVEGSGSESDDDDKDDDHARGFNSFCPYILVHPFTEGIKQPQVGDLVKEFLDDPCTHHHMIVNTGRQHSRGEWQKSLRNFKIQSNYVEGQITTVVLLGVDAARAVHQTSSRLEERHGPPHQ